MSDQLPKLDPDDIWTPEAQALWDTWTEGADKLTPVKEQFARCTTIEEVEVLRARLLGGVDVTKEADKRARALFHGLTKQALEGCTTAKQFLETARRRDTVYPEVVIPMAQVDPDLVASRVGRLREIHEGVTVALVRRIAPKKFPIQAAEITALDPEFFDVKRHYGTGVYGFILALAEGDLDALKRRLNE